MTQIICKELSLGYDGVSVCQNLSFEVSSGDYLCVVGDNGSGKSTLVKTLLGLCQPLGGEIFREDGMRVGDIGYLPQRSEDRRDFPATVREVVTSGCVAGLKNRFFYSRRNRETVSASMSTMNITDLADKPYNKLSGGQMQRVLLARALCAAKKTLLLDEPVSGLDPASSAEMYEVISHLNSHGLTVIMITHDIQAALKYATKILHMGSSPVFFESVADYIESPFYKEEELING